MSLNRSWIRITECRNIPLREGRAVSVAGHDVAIFNLGDRFLAIQNHCPHKGGPLADGIVSGTTVVCPLHAWKVDLSAGIVTSPPPARNCVQAFRVRVESGWIFLELHVDAGSQVRRPETGEAEIDTLLGATRRASLACESSSAVHESEAAL